MGSTSARGDLRGQQPPKQPDGERFSSLGLDIASDLSQVDRTANRLTVAVEGPVDVALMAMLIDMAGGLHAIHRGIVEHGEPCSISTMDLNLFGFDDVAGPGVLVTEATTVSRTSTRSCMRIVVGMEGGPTALGTVTFKLWPATMDLGDPSTWRTGAGTEPLTEPIKHRLGIVADPSRQRAQVSLARHVANHVASLQGGVTAGLLAEAAHQTLTPAERLAAMNVTFLSQGRVGPFVATARRVGATVTVDAVDTGNQDRPVATALFSVRTAP